MQKLVIQSQFMGVKPCEIEIRKFLLLIGEQASGKSTIAKLIYFFQTLPDAVYSEIVLSFPKSNSWNVNDGTIEKTAERKFEEMFGAVYNTKPFKVIFYYGEKGLTTLQIQSNESGLIKAEFNTGSYVPLMQLTEDLINDHPKFQHRREDEIRFRERQRKFVDEVFKRKNNRYTYFISGRNSVVANPEIFEKVAAAEIEKLINAEVEKDDFENRLLYGNERLLLQFIDWSQNIRDYFNKNGKSFSQASLRLENKSVLMHLEKISDRILKGKYSSEDSGESIFIETASSPISLKEASSGQQESLRILQGIFLAIGLKNRKEFLIIEEPEAHLFPLAQRELINAFALFLNTIPEGRLIITTHSPYILACVNLLLMAGYTSRQNGEVLRQKVGEAVPQGFWLNSDDFNAYALGGEEYRHDIKDGVTGLISENYLDNISEHLGMQFHQLYDLLTQPA